jgi:hypothetical protein
LGDGGGGRGGGGAGGGGEGGGLGGGGGGGEGGRGGGGDGGGGGGGDGDGGGGDGGRGGGGGGIGTMQASLAASHSRPAPQLQGSPVLQAMQPLAPATKPVAQTHESLEGFQTCGRRVAARGGPCGQAQAMCMACGATGSSLRPTAAYRQRRQASPLPQRFDPPHLVGTAVARLAGSARLAAQGAFHAGNAAVTVGTRPPRGAHACSPGDAPPLRRAAQCVLKTWWQHSALTTGAAAAR